MADITKFNGYNLKDKQLREDILETKMYLGYTDENVIGLLADFENNTFTRLGGAVGKSAGEDFNVYNMYGNRKVCAVQDDGTISKWWGEDGYVEDGSIGQIMVRQPKFYYKVVPLKLAPIEPDDTDQSDTEGYYLKKVNYYISDSPPPGFKVHPAFIGRDGTEKDCYYIGSYEASLWDASENEYRKYDTWDVSESGGVYTINAFNTYLADVENDKLCSIAGVKPASSEYSVQFKRFDTNTMGENRGSKWGSINVKILSAEQMLFAIEFGTFNTQTSIQNGVTHYDAGTHDESVFTGSTSSLGNGIGAAASSSRLVSDGTYETNTNNGYKSVRYRGVENFWGNVWAYVSGINIWGNGKMGGGEAYICDDFDFAESKNDGNYKPVGFTLPYRNGGYYKYFGYSATHDWIFLPAGRSLSTSVSMIGDVVYSENKTNSYKITYIGGSWSNTTLCGGFTLNIRNGIDTRGRHIGSRLIYID